MSEDIYRRIQRQLDQYSIGFPETESGVEIDILKFLFNEEDARLFSQLTDELESPDMISRRMGLPETEVTQNLEKMAQKGLLYRVRKGGRATYCAAPFLHGLLEFQSFDMPKALVALTGKYINEKLKNNLAGNTGFRVLPIQESIEFKSQITTADQAFEILRQEELIVLAECSCRLQYKQFDRACDAPLESCLFFGHMGEYYLENRMGRRITSDEAIKVIEAGRAAGLVTQMPETGRNHMMCNCCKCCCGILGSVRRTSKPAELVVSDHYCQVTAASCSGCEACLDQCQVQALSMNEEEVAEISLDRCIGCGLCIPSCQDGALMLVSRPKKMPASRISVKSAFTFYDFKN